MAYELLSQNKKLEHFLKKKKKNKQGGTVIRDPRVATTFCTEVKILKICFSEIAFFGVFLVQEARHLCRLFCYHVSCFCSCLHYVQYSPCSQGTKNLVLEKTF